MQRPSPRFKSERYFICEISGEMFYPNLQSFVWRRHVGAHTDWHQQGGWKAIETSVTEFCNESVHLILEELINIKVILFLTHELFRYTIARNKSHDSSLQGHPIDLFGKFLLAGTCGGNNMSLEGKRRWEKDKSECLRGFDVQNSCYQGDRLLLPCC